AYFRFTDTDGLPRFVIQLVEPAKIDHARRILAGKEKSRIHLNGTIVKAPAAYNPGWRYHLDPRSIDFFEFAVEVCDASIQYVEEHLDEVGGEKWRELLIRGGFPLSLLSDSDAHADEWRQLLRRNFLDP
ncbi:MAG: hypothetical protein HC938_07310, partial [Nitrospira sp.]|nr:hypothetical protein [Nitrospira sp.]